MFSAWVKTLKHQWCWWSSLYVQKRLHQSALKFNIEEQSRGNIEEQCGMRLSLDQYCNSQQAHSDRTLWSGSGQLLHNFRSGQGHLTHKNVFSKEAGANFLTLHRSSSQIWPGIFRPWLTVTIKYCKLSHTHPHTHTNKQTVLVV